MPDEKTWELKDKLSARQSALKAAAWVYEGKEIEADKLKAYAEELFAWLWRDKYKNDKETAPRPNTQELRVLTKLAEKVDVDFDELCRIVWAKYGRYPRLEKSVDKILAECFS